MNDTIKTLLEKNDLDITIIIVIGTGLIISYTLYYLIRSNNTAIPTKNMEVLTNQEIPTKNMEALTNQDIGATVNENAVTEINNKNKDAITDNDSETDTDVDTQSTSDNESFLESATSSDSEVDLDLAFLPPAANKIITEAEKAGKFIMPDVDLNVCPIEELKLFEFKSLYSKELSEHSVSDEDLMELISIFSKKDFATN
jgi:hypothetical protein